MGPAGGETERDRPDDARKRRTDEHTEAHGGFVIGFAKGERADEEAHRETDPRKDARAVERRPTGAGGQVSPTGADHQHRRAEDAELLAEKKPRGDAERDR